MSEVFNIYCDESCHLEHDGQPVMVLGAVWCPLEKTREIADRMRQIRQSHNLDPALELKWGKVSPAQLAFYANVLDYFLNEPDLHFRALVVPDKSKLRHEDFQQDHDTWYYKMYYEMLKVIIEPDNRYRIYLDLKDTHGGRKVAILLSVLRNRIRDAEGRIVERVQQVRSHEVQQVQMADFLTGLICYANRCLDTSPAKVQLVQHMRKRLGRMLTGTTAPSEQKVNLFRWKPQGDEDA